MLTIENLEKQLNSKELHAIYLLYGQETFLMETMVKKIITLFGKYEKGINYINIDDANYIQLLSELETPAFGYEKKILIARNTGIFKKEGKRKNGQLTEFKTKLNEYIINNINSLKSNIVLVFIEEEVEPKQQICLTIDKLGIMCKFDFQKPIYIEKRLKSICNAYKVQINNETLKYFIECCGTNMQELINEIRKLIEYAGENGQIEKSDIDGLAIKKLESVIFDLTDNIGKKDITKALEVLENLLYAKEPLQKILITLYNHFKKIYLVKLSLKYNKDIITTLKLKPNQTFLVNKYKAQSRFFEEKELKNIIQKLIDLDYNYKNGLIDLQVGLESILCAYCS